MLLVVDSKDDSQYGVGTVQVRYRYGTYGTVHQSWTGLVLRVLSSSAPDLDASQLGHKWRS